MGYDLRFSDRTLKALKQIDRYQAKIIVAWIEKNLDDCSDPRRRGKSLAGDKRSFWRYRVGGCRLIAEIDDVHATIDIINIAHRRNVYDE